MSNGALLSPSRRTVSQPLPHAYVQFISQPCYKDSLDPSTRSLGDDVERGGGYLGLLVEEEARKGAEGEAFEQDQGQETVLKAAIVNAKEDEGS